MSQQYLTITALTKYLKRKFDADPHLERIYLTGEMSNFRPRPGHQYFSLKDDHAKISAVMFKSAFDKLQFKPEEGMKVLVIGRISLYPSSGSYQIYIEHMEPDGIGALYQAYEQLKQKLAKEGLFDLKKKLLPKYPRKIAVLTSPSGAVIRDIMTTVKRRYPLAQIVLYPTVVQGEKTAAAIIKNIERVETDGTYDTMIIGRGGGSIEDLWPFNEETVARAIAQAQTPIISSVGHETDTTIADLVADVRAATPTAAAELAVPVLTEEILRIEEKQTRLQQVYIRQIERKKERYEKAVHSYIFRQPDRLYEAQAVKIDQLNQRLLKAMQMLYFQKEKAATQTMNRLQHYRLDSRVNEQQQKIIFITQRLQSQMNMLMERKQQQFAQAMQSLDLLSPLKIMSRGYNYTTKDQVVVKSVEQIQLDDQLIIHYQDGRVQVKVEEIQEEKKYNE